MNSLPFISPHLFVAAIGDESRAQERPTPRESLSTELAEQASTLALEWIDARQPVPASAIRPMRATIHQAGA